MFEKQWHKRLTSLCSGCTVSLAVNEDSHHTKLFDACLIINPHTVFVGTDTNVLMIADFQLSSEKKQLVLWTARSHACALRVTRVPVVYPITVSTGSILNHWPGDECFYRIRTSSILTGSFYSNSELAELPMCMQYSFRCRQTGFACICRITLVFIYEELVAHSEYIYCECYCG